MRRALEFEVRRVEVPNDRRPLDLQEFCHS